MTLSELRAYLEEMTRAAHAYNVEQNAAQIAVHMWKRFTPQAISVMTTAGVLQHIAYCLSPPEAKDGDGAEDY